MFLKNEIILGIGFYAFLLIMPLHVFMPTKKIASEKNLLSVFVNFYLLSSAIFLISGIFAPSGSRASYYIDQNYSVSILIIISNIILFIIKYYKISWIHLFSNILLLEFIYFISIAFYHSGRSLGLFMYIVPLFILPCLYYFYKYKNK